MLRVVGLICSLMFVLAASVVAVAQRDETPSARGLQRRNDAAPKIDPPAPCNIDMSSLPRFADVYIGMPYDDVASVYGEIASDKHFHKTFDLDGSGIFMIQAKDAKTPVRDDIVQVSLNFKDRAIWIMSLVFTEKKWNSVKDAVAESSRMLGVEESSWKIYHGESAEITCMDFKLGVSSLPGEPRINSLAIHPLQYTR